MGQSTEGLQMAFINVKPQGERWDQIHRPYFDKVFVVLLRETMYKIGCLHMFALLGGFVYHHHQFVCVCMFTCVWVHMCEYAVMCEYACM